MSFKNIGRNFKTKSGKATTVILSESDLAEITKTKTEHEKYGIQYKILVSGSPESKYGHSIAVIQPEDNSKEVEQW
jgi:hypothetical protein